jgi:NitT/TauT family transport system permease protein
MSVEEGRVHAMALGDGQDNTIASRSRSWARGGKTGSRQPATTERPSVAKRWNATRALFTFRGKAPARLQLWVGIGAFVFVIAAWLLITELGLVKPQFLPSPVAVIGSLWRLLWEANYIEDIGISVARVWVAFLASAVIAIPLGILMSSYRAVGAVTEPLVDFVRYLPVPALVPLTLIWLGIGESSKVMLLWIGTFFQLVLLIAEDARRVPHEFIETGRTLGAGDGALMKDVLLPAMLDSLRITLGWCWTYLIVAEIVAANSGIGYQLWTARRYGKTPEVFAGILAIGVIGLATDQVIRVLHRRVFRYLG